MNEPMDRVFADWLREGPESGPGAGLTEALAATRRTGQRPGWTLPERWLPVQLTMTRMPSLRPLLAIIVLALLTAALVGGALFAAAQRRQPLLPFGPARNGAIVYAVDGDLFIADHAHGAPRVLVAGPETDSNPVFSDLGDQIAFGRHAMDETRIMAIRPDGSAIKELATGLPGTVTELRWSPDGSALLALVDEGIGEVRTGKLYLIDGDGSGFRRLDQGSGYDFGGAAWRPNGRHIATWGEAIAAPNEDGPPSLYIVDADGTNARRAAADVDFPFGIEWSPDGTHLAFASSDGLDGPFRINIADIDESGALTALHTLRLDPLSHEVTPKWSPDGRQVAFLTEKDARSHIGIVESDGTGFQIVGPELSDPEFTAPTWSPDGRSLVVNEDGRPPRTASEQAWLIDPTTGAMTEVGMPVDSWQRLAP